MSSPSSDASGDVAALAELVRATPVAVQLHTLLGWLGDRRQLTSSGVLRMNDARAACEALGFRPYPDWANLAWSGDAANPTSQEGLPTPPVRTARQIGRLHRLWVLAEATGWIEIVRHRARPGPAWPAARDGNDAQLLGLWNDIFEAVLELGPDAGQERRYPTALDDGPQLMVLHALSEAFDGTPHDVDELVQEMLADASEGMDAEATTMVASIERRRLTRYLGRLVDIGAIVDGAERVELTPLGRWGMAQRRSLAESAVAG